MAHISGPGFDSGGTASLWAGARFHICILSLISFTRQKKCIRLLFFLLVATAIALSANHMSTTDVAEVWVLLMLLLLLFLLLVVLLTMLTLTPGCSTARTALVGVTPTSSRGPGATDSDVGVGAAAPPPCVEGALAADRHKAWC